MRTTFAVAVLAFSMAVPAAGLETARETVGIGSEHYGHEWAKDSEQVQVRQQRYVPYCRVLKVNRDGVTKQIKRCY